MAQPKGAAEAILSLRKRTLAATPHHAAETIPIPAAQPAGITPGGTMSYDYTAQPEFAGPGSEPAGATGVRFPEEFGPGTLSGAEYGRAGYCSIGAIPPLMDPATRDRERAECERRNLLRQQVGQAALAAARNALLAASITDQVLADTAAAVEKAVAAAPAEPAAVTAGTEAS